VDTDDVVHAGGDGVTEGVSVRGENGRTILVMTSNGGGDVGGVGVRGVGEGDVVGDRRGISGASPLIAALHAKSLSKSSKFSRCIGFGWCGATRVLDELLPSSSLLLLLLVVDVAAKRSSASSSIGPKRSRGLVASSREPILTLCCCRSISHASSDELRLILHAVRGESDSVA
jgi:hypothetical protein